MATSRESEMLDQRLPLTALNGAEETLLVADAVEQLRGFARLEADWNSYGAQPISPIAITIAVEFLSQIARLSHTRPDFVAPLANGGVQLEWSGVAAEIEVRVSPDQTLAYLLMEENAHIEKHDAPLGEVLGLVVRRNRS